MVLIVKYTIVKISYFSRPFKKEFIMKMGKVFVVFAVIGMFINFALYSEANPEDGLVLHLSFDGEYH